MNFIKNLFSRVLNWIAAPFAYVAVKATELTLPVYHWLFVPNNSPTPSFKAWAKAALGLTMFLCMNVGFSLIGTLLVVAITTVLALVLPVLLANLLASLAAGFCIYVLIMRVIAQLPAEITVTV